MRREGEMIIDALKLPEGVVLRDPVSWKVIQKLGQRKIIHPIQELSPVQKPALLVTVKMHRHNAGGYSSEVMQKRGLNKVIS